jgi:MSHA pilin protein MshD
MSTADRQSGVSLVETILFMVIVSVAVIGVTSVFMTTTRSSADPLVRKQALAIAESLLEEVRLMPFTWCDPDDANVYTATGTAGCSVGFVENMGPDTIAAITETRYLAGNPFDNVNDYSGFDSAAAVPAGICDISGACIAALAGYRAQVAVAATAFNGIPAADALLITVTVTGPTPEAISLSAVRTRYAPNL